MSIAAINAIQDRTLTTPNLHIVSEMHTRFVVWPLFLQHEAIRIDWIEGCVILSFLHAML